jgi:hypothetical protein
MREKEFWQSANRFRDLRRWRIEGAEWWKADVCPMAFVAKE